MDTSNCPQSQPEGSSSIVHQRRMKATSLIPVTVHSSEDELLKSFWIFWNFFLCLVHLFVYLFVFCAKSPYHSCFKSVWVPNDNELQQKVCHLYPCHLSMRPRRSLFKPPWWDHHHSGEQCMRLPPYWRAVYETIAIPVGNASDHCHTAGQCIRPLPHCTAMHQTIATLHGNASDHCHTAGQCIRSLPYCRAKHLYWCNQMGAD